MGRVNVTVITEEESFISDIKLVSTATVGRINNTSHVNLTILFLFIFSGSAA
jgi:hypothetical protein